MTYTYAKAEGQYEIWDGQQLVGTATDLRHARLFCKAQAFRRIIYDLRDELSRIGPHGLAITKQLLAIIDSGMERPAPQKRRNA